MDVKTLCESLDVHPATYYRSKAEAKEVPVRRSHRRLTDFEKENILATLISEEFADKPPAVVYHTLGDRGEYLCSISTMYKILRENQAVKERRNQLQHPEYVKPVLVATTPNQVWSWDITKLKGPCKGSFFYLYSVIDIFSRYTVGWTVAPRENGLLARNLIETICERQGIATDQLIIHSDRGSPMKSNTESEMMMNLGILKSFSRPRVSNDNPYIESHFKTLKYRPTFPDRFGSIEDAREFLRKFYDWYNNAHYHSGIAMMTPASVHHGQVAAVLEKRQHTLEAAYKKHPERFVRGLLKPKTVPQESWINQPCKGILEAA